ncbi:anaerobic benzoate catabolism transcriptional regulator [compost metagenome]
MHFTREATGARLQEERKRLGLNQDEFAQHVGVAKRTLAGYEGGSGDVGATVLGVASDLGVDVLYVVTGVRTPAPADSLSPLEARVVSRLRSMPEPSQETVDRVTEALAAQASIGEGKKTDTR